MSILRFHHAQITIPRGEEDKARAFYCTLLGLREVQKPVSLRGRGGFWLQVGEQELHVGVEDGVERARTKAHLAYEVDDVTAWRRRLQSKGISTKESIAIPGFRRFEIRDPFGNRVEFIEPEV